MKHLKEGKVDLKIICRGCVIIFEFFRLYSDEKNIEIGSLIELIFSLISMRRKIADHRDRTDKLSNIRRTSKMFEKVFVKFNISH
jgi:hypothetical protein